MDTLEEVHDSEGMIVAGHNVLRILSVGGTLGKTTREENTNTSNDRFRRRKLLKVRHRMSENIDTE